MVHKAEYQLMSNYYLWRGTQGRVPVKSNYYLWRGTQGRVPVNE